MASLNPLDTSASLEYVLLLASAHPFALKEGLFELEEAGYRVVVCSKGAEILPTLQEEMPTVLIIDLDMQNQEGDIVAQAIVGSAEFERMPMLLLWTESGSGDRGYPQWVWNTNKKQLIAFLRVPFLKGELREFLRRILRAVAGDPERP